MNPLEDFELEYDATVDEDDKIVGRIWTRRQALMAGSLASLATLFGCGGSGGGSSSGGTTGEANAAITTQPTSQTVSAGGTATFTVVAGGTNLTYQWYRGGVAILGATGATYSLSAVSSGDSGATFSVKVANSAGSVTSNTVTLTVGSGIDLVATPEAIEGPFWVDENLNRSDLVSPGASRSTVSGGFPLTLTFTLYNYDSGTKTGTPLSGAHVDIWHADTHGVYSDESSGSIQSENTVGQTWLRGYQVTDSGGGVTFSTIHPGWYTGRTPHIHVRIRTYSASGNVTHNLTTQMFFTDAQNAAILSKTIYSHGTQTVFDANDNVYSVKQSDGTTVGSHLMLNVSQGSTSETASFSLAFALS